MALEYSFKGETILIDLRLKHVQQGSSKQLQVVKEVKVLCSQRLSSSDSAKPSWDEQCEPCRSPRMAL